jgi:hypothetical protein
MMILQKIFKIFFLKESIIPNDSCLNNFKNFKILVWDTAMNETHKINVLKYYFKRSENKTYINSCLRLCSNECMVNEILAIQIIKQKCHHMFYEKVKCARSKWLMYSTFWNIFRFESSRNLIKEDFVNKIIDDLPEVIDIDRNDVYNVYFGCLSNISLANIYKKKILKNISNLSKLQIYILTNSSEKNLSFYTTICGLFANLAVDDNLCDELLETLLFEISIANIKKLFDSKEFDISGILELNLIKNFLSMINNFLAYKKMIKKLIRHNLYDVFLKIEDELVENQNLFNTIDTIFTLIKQTLFVNLNFYHFSHITNLHLANDFEFLDIIFEKILFENENINSIDISGNTILHNALKDNNFELAKYYILANANIYHSNNDNETPYDINKEFVEEILILKNEINKLYIKKINKIFKHYNILKYEPFIANVIGSYIDITNDVFKFWKKNFPIVT